MKLNQQLKDSLLEEFKNLTDRCTAINERRKYNQVRCISNNQEKMREALAQREQKIQLLTGSVVNLELGVEKYRKNIDQSKLDHVKAFEWTS